MACIGYLRYDCEDAESAFACEMKISAFFVKVGVRSVKDQLQFQFSSYDFTHMM